MTHVCACGTEHWTQCVVSAGQMAAPGAMPSPPELSSVYSWPRFYILSPTEAVSVSSAVNGAAVTGSLWPWCGVNFPWVYTQGTAERTWSQWEPLLTTLRSFWRKENTFSGPSVCACADRLRRTTKSLQFQVFSGKCVEVPLLESQKQKGGFPAGLGSAAFLYTCHGAAAFVLGHTTFYPLPARGLRWLPWGLSTTVR